MAQENRSTIKTYFETGDVPTQGQFANSFDSQVFWVDDVETDLTSNSDSKVPTVKAVVDGQTYTKDSNDNVFYKGVTATLGSGCKFNTFEQDTNGFIFGNGLICVTIKSGAIGADYTASPDFNFLYGLRCSSEIFRNPEGTANYHRYYDPTNDRIVLTNLTTLAVSYIGGGGGGGDAYLANDQTFTGENTFAIASGTKEPIIVTKGGNGAGIKVTKSSGSGDAIEVAQGSLSIADETASTIAHLDSNKRVKSLNTSTYPSLTELSYAKGVTSAIQTQIDIARRSSILFSPGNVNPVDNTTYYFSTALGIGTTAASFVMSLGYAFRVIGATIQAFNNSGTVGSSENSTLQLRNVTQVSSSSIGTFKTNAAALAQTETTITGLNISVAATDFFALQWDFPTATTNPTNVFLRVNLIIQFL